MGDQKWHSVVSVLLGSAGFLPAVLFLSLTSSARLGAAADPVFPATPGNTAAAQARRVGPQIVFEEEVINFGRVEHGRRIPHTFRFTNTGSKLLEILNVDPACGCTRAGAWDRTVAPAQSGQIPLELDTTGMVGGVRRSIKVTTNVPSRRELRLWLEGEVEAALSAEPASLAFGVLYPENQPWRKRVRIIPLQAKAAALELPHSDSPAFVATLRETQPGKEFELAVEARSGLTPGAYAGEIKVRLSGAGANELVIPVSAYMPDAVLVRPKQIKLRSDPLPAAQERTLSVRYTRAGRLEIGKVAVLAPGVTAKVQTIKAGREFRITVKFPQGFVLPPDGTAAQVETNDPGARVVTIPILADRVSGGSGGTSQRR